MLVEHNLTDELTKVFSQKNNTRDKPEILINQLQGHTFNLWTKRNKNWFSECERRDEAQRGFSNTL